MLTGMSAALLTMAHWHAKLALTKGNTISSAGNPPEVMAQSRHPHALCNQINPPLVPAKGEGDSLKIIQIENASLSELSKAFLGVVEVSRCHLVPSSSSALSAIWRRWGRRSAPKSWCTPSGLSEGLTVLGSLLCTVFPSWSVVSTVKTH